MPTALEGFFKSFRKCCLVAGAFAALRPAAVTEFPMTGFLVAVTLVSIFGQTVRVTFGPLFHAEGLTMLQEDAQARSK